MNDVFVTPQSHPVLFQALEMISHDRGAGAGHSHYAIPAEHGKHLDEVEDAVKHLTATELETFAIGEGSEAQAIADREPGLGVAHKFLDAFFEDFEEG